MREARGSESAAGIAELASRLAGIEAARGDMIVGLTGSVASGKTTLAERLVAELAGTLRVDMVSTDGFLLPNAVLDARGLTLRKGFPESYDVAAMAGALAALREGAAVFPAYSHVTYDVDPALARRIEAPDILLLEGLGFQPPEKTKPAGAPDLLIYLDAELADLEAWYLERFVRLWHAAEHDPSSFYARFRHMSEPELVVFAKSVWEQINLPNLQQHILPLRDVADIVVRKDAGHAVQIVADRVGD